MKDYILRLKNEAHNWENASPIGAGSIGAMVFGNPGSERYCLNEETIWNGDKQDACNHGYIDNLRKARAMFLDGKNAEAEKWAQENLQERNYAIKSYEFAGDLFVDVHGDSEKDSYERLLDLKNGLLNINYEMYGIKYSRECFASHPAKLLCMRLDT